MEFPLSQINTTVIDKQTHNVGNDAECCCFGQIARSAKLMIQRKRGVLVVFRVIHHFCNPVCHQHDPVGAPIIGLQVRKCQKMIVFPSILRVGAGNRLSRLQPMVAGPLLTFLADDPLPPSATWRRWWGRLCFGSVLCRSLGRLG